jgi:hypothetical protein
VVPYLSNKPISSIEAPDLLEVLKRIEAKGVIDTAHRTRIHHRSGAGRGTAESH